MTMPPSETENVFTDHEKGVSWRLISTLDPEDAKPFGDR